MIAHTTSAQDSLRHHNVPTRNVGQRATHFRRVEFHTNVSRISPNHARRSTTVPLSKSRNENARNPSGSHPQQPSRKKEIARYSCIENSCPCKISSVQTNTKILDSIRSGVVWSLTERKGGWHTNCREKPNLATIMTCLPVL